MEFYQLEAFVAVADCRSFSRAAEKLFLSQPTVSAHIKTLESELGTQLFDRGKTDLLLTSSGDLLYRYAKDMLDMRLHVLTELLDKDSVTDEAITVAASSVPCQYLLPTAIAAFGKLHPNVRVNLRQENSRTVCENIFNYQYPLGIAGERYSLPRLHFEPLKHDELMVAFPNSQTYKALLDKEKLQLADLKPFLLLLRESGSGTRSLFEQALTESGNSIEQFSYQIFDNQETIKQAVRQGLGISVLSRFVVEDYLEFGLLAARPLHGLCLERVFCLVTYDKRVKTPATRALISFLRTYFSQGEK